MAKPLANIGDRGVLLTAHAAQRIANAVSKIERGDRSTHGQTFRTGYDDGVGDGIRLGTISAPWNKGSTATVTQLAGDGTAISPTVTFEAKNWFATVTGTGTKKVACGLVGDAWILIAAEC